MADKAKLTPDSGYLTRRMITVSRDFFVVTEDCHTTDGISKPKKDCVGRFTCDGELIGKNDSSDIVKIRTPVYCKADKGFCVKCYGTNPATRKLVTVGSNVGAVAAHSLTESTTQMTMKTFHTSGAAVVNDSPLLVKTSISGYVKITTISNFHHIDVFGDDLNYTYIIDANKARLSVKDGDTVSEGDRLAVYTDEGLENDDVSGSLPKITALYEASVPTHSKECAIAPFSGKVRLEASVGKNAVLIYINNELVDIVSGVPIFVANGEEVELGKILSFGAPNVGKFYEKTKDLSMAYKIFETSVMDICRKEKLFPNLVHLEVIFRCMSNLVVRDDGILGLRSHNDKGDIKLLGINQIGRIFPSWLKSIGYGYTTEILTTSAVELRETYDLSSEKLMYGDLIFDYKQPVKS